MDKRTVNNNIEAVYELTPMQEGMLFHNLLDENSTQYILQVQMEIRRAFDEARSREALSLLMLRYEVLRTSFTAKTKIPLQAVRKSVQPEYLVEDRRGQAADREMVNALMRADLRRGFRLDKELPIRITHICFDDAVFLIWSVHHIVIDGWSLSTLMASFMKYYQLLESGAAYTDACRIVERDRLEDLAYKDFVQWQSAHRSAESMSFWKSLLSGYEDKQIVPMLPPSDAEDSGVCELLLENSVYESVRNLALTNQVTVSTVIESAFGRLLQLRTGTDDVVIGKVVSGRDAPLQNIGSAVGLYVNTIASRIRSQDNQSIAQLLTAVSKQAAETLPYAQTSLMDVQKNCMDGGKIVGLYAFENFYVNPKAEKRMQAYGISLLSSREKTNYPLTLRAYENNGLRLTLMFDEKIFCPQECELLLGQMHVILAQMCRKDASVASVTGVSERDAQEILHDFNNTAVPYPRNGNVVEELEKQVVLHREKTAIVYEDREITYEQLSEMSSNLAGRLKALGVGRGTCVALLAKRSPELMLAITAILRAGGVYVPIDTAYPRSRVEMVLEECEPKVILTDGSSPVDARFGTVLHLEDSTLFSGSGNVNMEHMEAEDPAYIIYTSGTTGRPKGAVISHRAILRLVKNASFARMDENSCLLQMGAVAFDASTFEIWGMLLNGGTLYLANESMVLDTRVFKQTVAQYGINIMWMTAALFNLHIANDPSAFDGIEQLLIGGEKLSEHHVRLMQAHNRDTVLINGYGPTENTTFTTTYRIPLDFERIPIGKPISNTGVVILRDGKLCGIGMPGELLCWGDGLASGYLKNSALTESRFVKSEGFDVVMYKTGDLARWLPDGSIEYLGRIDQQVKIRGFRVEIAEIEKAIRAIDDVQDCVVLAQPVNGENLLCAYVVCTPELDFADVREALRTEMPEYMIPAFWGRIDAVPLTVNGKVDRRALPDIMDRSDGNKSAPEGEREKCIAEIFGQILGLDTVYREDQFFDLGGHSLRAMMLINAIESNTGIRLTLKDVFQNPTVMGLAALLTESTNAVTIPKAPEMERYLMSPAQQRMYILSKREENSLAYNMPCCVRIPGRLDFAKLTAALGTVVAAHESLRTVFMECEGAFYQKICADMPLEIMLEERDGEVDCQTYIERFIEPFDLENGPLVRIRCVQGGAYTYVLFDMHHIIADGMSMNVFIRDLLTAYEGKPLAPHTLHYRDYAEWMRTRDMSRQERFWLEELGENMTVLNMPYDHVRPAVQSYSGGIVKQTVPDALRRQVMKLAKQTGTTEFMILASVLMILLSKYSNQENITVGTVVSGRAARETENMMGVFVNTVVLRADVREDDRFLDFLNTVKSKCLSAFDNQEYPFDLLCQKLNLARDTSRNALFDVMFSLQNNEENALPKDVEVISDEENAAAKFDLSVDVHPARNGYQIDYTFCRAIYDKETIERFSAHYLSLLQNVVTDKAARISELEETDAAEQEKLLLSFNPQRRSLPETLNVVGQFRQTAVAHPDRQAVVYLDEHCTYGELASRVERVAAGLCSRGVGAGDRVALILRRGVDMIVGIYAVLYVGAAYVPIEPSYPEERKRYILRDADPALVVCDKNQEPTDCNAAWTSVSELERLDAAAKMPCAIAPKDAAYIIYTSGTTGKPKGVVLHHDGLINLCVVLNRYAYEKYEAPVNGALLASYCFDASVQQLFVPLLYGHTLHIISDETKIDPEAIFAYYVSHKIRVSDGTPSHLKLLLERPMPTIYADTFLIGGEALSPNVVKAFTERYPAEIYNVYGPTETTVDATIYRCVPSDGERKSLPIGKPLDNVSAYVLRGERLCGIDVPGELCIGGIGVGEGYRNLPEETASRFVPNPFDGTVMYRTGDIARWRGDGNLEYLGRLDQQVKIRGFRIEIKEVESALLECASVCDCAVAVREIRGEQALCAYLVFENNQENQLGNVARSLKRTLPTYMIPQYWASCAQLPKNNSGKLDYSRLEGELVAAEQESYSTPETETELLVAEAFAEVIGCERVGRSDDFFSLGGYSLNAVRVINLIEEKANVRLKLQDVFMHPVVSELAAIVASKKAVNNPILPCEEAPTYAVSPAQLRMYTMQMLDDVGTSYNMPMCFHLEGVVNVRKIENCLLALTKRHETLRTSFVFENGELFQKISEESRLDFTVTQVQKLLTAAEYMKMFIRPFDLHSAPLMRVELVIGPDAAFLLFDMHHIISDGRSINVLFEEFAEIYSGGEPTLPTVQYKDYAAWLQKQELKTEEEFWQEQYAEELPVLDIPTDFPRPQSKDFSGDLVRCEIGHDLIEKLHGLIKGTAITEYSVFLSVLMVTLSKYGRQEDVIVGTSVSGRNHKDTENMLGMFVNTLALRGKPSRDKRFSDFLNEIVAMTVKAFDNQSYPFENIVGTYGVQGDHSRNPIFDVMLTLQNNEQIALELDNLKIRVEETGITAAKFDLDVDIVPGPENYEVLCAYAVSLFRRETAEGILSHFVFFLEYLLEHPECKLGDLPLETEEERIRIEERFHKKSSEKRGIQKDTVICAFEAQAEATPDRIALEMGETQYTYDALNKRANRMAHRLRELGVRPDEPVVILSNRSMDAIAAIYAIQKAGGAYFPVDPAYGKERIDFILQDCGARIVLVGENISFSSDKVHIEPLGEAYSLYSQENLPPAADAKNLMYLTSTSGSTGTPKSVMIENGAVLSYVSAFSKEFQICQDDIVLQQSALNFDTVVEELYPAHLCGGKVVLLPQDRIIDVSQAYSYIVEKQVTVISCSTLLLSEFNALHKPCSVRLYLNGGDVLKYEYIDYLQTYAEVGNTFGPTECTVCAALYHVPQGSGKISVGHPIPAAKLYVVGGNDRLCGIGVPGELWIGGDCVGRGYLNRDALNQEKFIQNPFGEGRVFKTGDAVRWLPDGNLEYLGRIDQQVKIRGFRVELGEIESVMRKNAQIRECVVVARTRENGDRYLCAYYVTASDEELNTQTLKREMAEFLPGYMVPQYMMRMDALPLTGSGKINKRALPEIRMESEEVYEAPRTAEEEIVASAFREVLGVEQIGRNDNFFALGGHSLRAIRVVNLIEQKTGVRLALKEVFSHPTPAELAARLTGRAGYTPIPQAEKQSRYPMSSTQKRTYLITQVDQTGLSYNMPVALRVTGKLDVEKIENVFQELIDRHEVLRTTFKMEEGELVQEIVEEIRGIVDYEEVDEAAIRASFEAFVRPFDFEKAPLMRIAIRKAGTENWYIFFDMHHIISDGMSMNIIIEEFSRLYNGESLPEQRVQYKDYSEWMRSRDLRVQAEYWQEQFAEEAPTLELVTDYPRPQMQSFRGGSERMRLTEMETKAVEELCRKTESTAYMVFLSALMVTLSKYSRQEDIVIGSPISGRVHRDTETMLGMLVNTLAMRGRPEKDKSCAAFLAEVKECCLKAYENQEYPFEELVEAVAVRRELSRNPLFDVMLVLQNNEKVQIQLDGAKAEASLTPEAVAKFDLTFSIEEDGEGYVMETVYCADLYKAETIQWLNRHFVEAIVQMAEMPEEKIGNITLTSAEEQGQITGAFNATATAYPKDKTIVELFEEQAEKTPENVAVVYEDRQLTYGELNAKANQLGRRLRTLGVRPGDFVAIYAERSLEMFVGIFGVLKAGGAYVPIDPHYPEDRKQFMLADSAPKVIVRYGAAAMETTIPEIDLAQAEPWRGESTNPEHVSGPHDLAYVIYTSGTTGRPKGVMIEHYGVANLRQYFMEKQQVTSADRVLQFANYAFDAIISELSMSLLTGATLYVVPDETQKDIKLFEAFLAENGITIAILPPAFAAHVKLSGLRTLITAGSESSMDLVKASSEIAVYSNDYGPTEATVCATYWRHETGEPIPERIPIGRPICNKEIYILDGARLCGIGMPGELCIAGEGLARGYLNQPELTVEKFTDNPYGAGRLYRTGDLGRWLPDGNIEYLGRIDEQVKIRGFRIELGEIESAIRKAGKVKDCAVIVREDRGGDKAIHAYVVSDEAVSMAEIREEIGGMLPEYMIPTYMMQIGAIPVTRNGKLDKRALPEIRMESEEVYEAPRTAEEEIVASAFREVLGVEQIGRNDNFFALGGDSIKIMRVKALLQNSGFDFSVSAIMGSFDVAHCAAALRKMGINGERSFTGELKPIPMLKTFAEWKLQEPEYFCQSAFIELQEPDEAAIRKTLDYITQYHDALRMVCRDNAFLIRNADEGERYQLTVYREGTWCREEVTSICEQMRASFDLANGPLIKAGLFMEEKEGQLFLAIHHLAVDAVSWNILMEDFQNVYFACLDDREVRLPQKTMSYLEWSTLLEEYSKSEELNRTLDYWKTVEQKMPAVQFPAVSALRKSRSLILRKTDIPALNQSVHGDSMHNVLGCGFRELIAAALAHGKGQASVGLMVEGHGRNEILGQTPNRTVGWFTCESPVIIECGKDVLSTLHSASKGFSELEQKGNSYSVLRYISQAVSGCGAEIGYNFFSESLSQPEMQNAAFHESPCSSGRDISEKNAFGCPISVSARETADKICVECGFSEGYSEQEIEQYMARCRDALEALDEICAAMIRTESVLLNGRIWKQKEIRQWVLNLCAPCEAMMSDFAADRQYTPTFLQKVYLEAKENVICTHRVWLPAEDVEAVHLALGKVIREQYALRTGYNKARKTMNEYSADSPIEIAYADISENTNQTTEWIYAMTEQNLGVNQAFRKSALLSKIVLFKTMYGCMVYVFAHHAISDLRSAMVFENRLRFYLQNADQPVAQVPRYSELCGNSSPGDMYAEPLLAATKTYAKHLRALPSTYVYKYVFRENTETEKLPAAELGIRMMKTLIRQTGYSGSFPLIVMHHGRKCENMSTYGMFVRVIGVLLHTEENADDEKIIQDILSGRLEQFPDVGAMQQLRFMRYWKKVPVLNASISYNIDFGLTGILNREDMSLKGSGEVRPCSVLIRSGQDGLTLVLGGCTEDRAATEVWVRNILETESATRTQGGERELLAV